jgi:pilus assembly protein CpaE
LRNVVRLLTSFKENKELSEKIKIVINRAGLDTGAITLKKAQETIGREIFWQIPNDYRTMVEVRNNGVPLVEQAPKAAVTQSILGLAEALSGAKKDGEESSPAPTNDAKTKSGLFSFWSLKTSSAGFT